MRPNEEVPTVRVYSKSGAEPENKGPYVKRQWESYYRERIETIGSNELSFKMKSSYVLTISFYSWLMNGTFERFIFRYSFG